ncbi:hypothetical protein IGI04_026028 [Brassica rapa subsp. trilocularis]|uniref:Uncharacterized protein n=1 Tax=Brassica rapa subsp. trilocularis TaxID=1813537 RepID=A0ABQ7KYQ7_BRACM|nr:hypothetical protein IGI04_026028 [Brassica rapa subsp. trilocularis]
MDVWQIVLQTSNPWRASSTTRGFTWLWLFDFTEETQRKCKLRRIIGYPWCIATVVVSVIQEFPDLKEKQKFSAIATSHKEDEDDGVSW